ncbi:MAG TPA: peptidoglycan editing factor PgeF [Limnochordales bacterium]
MSRPRLVVRDAAGVRLWQVDAWAEQAIVHGFTGRGGGVSPPPFDSLNLGLRVGDDPERVRENRRRLCQVLGVSPQALVVGEQVHGNAVAVVTRAAMGRGALVAADALPGVDALVCAEPGPVLMGLFADCVPILLVDPRTPAVAMVHAGWRGTDRQVVVRALAAMAEAFGTRAADCWAALGPSIGPCCYEVGADVADRFAGWGGGLVQSREGRLYLDLPAANRRLLESAGVPARQILTAEVCTRCRMDQCFSHRGSGGRTGRMAAVIGL